MRALKGTVACLGLFVVAACLLAGEGEKEPLAQTPTEVVDTGNPVPNDAASIARGRDLYVKFHCTKCHGAGGVVDPEKRRKGDALGLRLPPDLGGRMVQSQTDGELFRRITDGNLRVVKRMNGRVEKGGMPSFKEKIPDEGRWDLVNYLRSLALEGVKPDPGE